MEFVVAAVMACCAVCGRAFTPRAYQLRRVRQGHALLCSQRCATRAVSSAKTGHPLIGVRPQPIGRLAPGTEFWVGTTAGTVVRQHRVMRETVVRYHNDSAKGTFRSVWPASISVRTAPPSDSPGVSSPERGAGVVGVPDDQSEALEWT
jgi:hypothetical protein